MNNIPFDFWIATGIVVAHMILCHILLERVKRESMATFEKIGAFHIFSNNTPRATWLFWKWLCSSGPSGFSAGTRILAWSIRLLTLVFMVWFLFQLGAIF